MRDATNTTRDGWTPVRPLMVAMLIGVALLLTTTRATAGPQSLEPYCEAGEVCLFEAADYLIEMKAWSGDDGSYYWDRYDVGGRSRVNDTASSLINNGRRCGSRHYEHTQYRGTSFWVRRGEAVDNLAKVRDGFHNRLSSHDWCDDRR